VGRGLRSALVLSVEEQEAPDPEAEPLAEVCVDGREERLLGVPGDRRERRDRVRVAEGLPGLAHPEAGPARHEHRQHEHEQRHEQRPAIPDGVPLTVDQRVEPRAVGDQDRDLDRGE